MQFEEILKKAEQISKEVLHEQVQETDTTGVWPKESMKALQETGLTGLVVSSEAGGLGQGLSGLVKVCEILAQECSSSSMCFGMHNVGTAVIAAKATENQHHHYLEQIAAGKHITTLALSEPGTGAHFYYPQTQLEPVEDGYKINGQKTFVTNGGHADSYVVSTMAIDIDAQANQFSCVIIDKETEGLQWGDPWNGFGMRGNSSKSMEINNVLINKDQLLGKEGDQLWYVFNVVAPYFLTAMAGTYLGIAQAAFNEAQNHLSKRTYSHSGSSLSEVGVIQHKLGMLWSKVERTRRLVYHAAQEGDLGDFAAVPYLLSAKAEVAHCAVEVVNEAMTLCGGIGYRENSKLSRLLRDARASHVMSPTTDLLYTWLGRSLLEQPILGE